MFIFARSASLSVSIPSIIILIVPASYGSAISVSISIILMPGSSVITIPMAIISMLLFFMISGSKWIRGLPASMPVFVFLFIFYWPRSPVGFRRMRSRSRIVFFLHYLDWYLFFAVLWSWNRLIFCALKWLNLFFLIFTFTNWFLTASASLWRWYQGWTFLTSSVLDLDLFYLLLSLTHFNSINLFIRDSI